MSQITKRALEQSLKNLLQQKPLSKITISDITEDCGISRMTFYYHFKDIYDLVEWACMEDAAKALQNKKTYDTWQQGFIQIFHAVRENKVFVMSVYRCVSREQVEKYLVPLTDQLIMGVIAERSAGMTVREEDKQFMLQSLGPQRRPHYFDRGGRGFVHFGWTAAAFGQKKHSAGSQFHGAASAAPCTLLLRGKRELTRKR